MRCGLPWQLKVFGRIYLAGRINAQISVPQSNVEALREFLYGFDPALAGLRFNIAVEDDGKSWVLRLKSSRSYRRRRHRRSLV